MKIHELGIHDLSTLLRSRKISTIEVLDAFIERIDATEERVQAFITITKDEAYKSARSIQEKLDKGDSLPKLAGIPIAVKDIICTKDIKTTCGSRMLENFVPPYNATVIDRLLEEGTVILGKTNMDEFAMGSSTENSYYKLTHNPWNTECVAGGSSGGSAAAVAAGQVPYSLGTDTGGSIRQPASFCGIVGIRPTYGAVSRYGVVAYASSLDQVGCFTKDVFDCAIVMNSILGHDKRDATSCNIEHPDFTKVLDTDVKGVRIGIPKEYFGSGISEDVKEAVLGAAKKYEEMGAVCEEVSLSMNEYAIPAYYIIACAEASSNLARYDGVKYGYRARDVDNLMDLYCKTRSEGFGNETKRRIMLGTFVLSSGYYDAYYRKAQQIRTLIRDQYEEAFQKCDFLLAPVSPTTAFKIGENSSDPLKMYLEDIYTVSLNIAGLPGMSIPCGYGRDGMPIGMQLIGKAFDEKTLLKAAYAFEKNTDFHHKRPAI